MDIWFVLTTLFLSLILGGVIGLEREVNEKKSDEHQGKPTAIIGLRSFSLISLLGAIVGLLYTQFSGLALLIGVSLAILVLLYYIMDALTTKEYGITTELGMLLSFIIGLLLATKLLPIQIILALTIVIVLLLSQKDRIKDVVEDIQKNELNAFVSFAIIALVILPFLPNVSYAFSDIPGTKSFLETLGVNVRKIADIDIINPFKLWLIVALITGVDFVGYVLEKTIGKKKGWLLASAVGGFVSSTAVTQSLAQESKDKKGINYLVSAALLANLVSFFQIAILIGVLNPILLIKFTPILFLMLVASTLLVLYFLRQKEAEDTHNANAKTEKHKTIIDIGSAVKFAVLFLTISVASKLALEFFGNTGFLAATGIGSLVGLDAVMINTAQLAGKTIDFPLAAFAFILANAINLFGKSFYSFVQGKREFAVKFLISILIIIGASLMGLFFV